MIRSHMLAIHTNEALETGTLPGNTNSIIFEYPLSEAIRVCLRLENLFNQLQESLLYTNNGSCKHALHTLLQILDIVDRPDLKTKLAQTMSQQSAALAQLSQSPKVDNARLKKLMLQLEELMEKFHQNRKKIGDNLRNNEFLSQIRASTYCSWRSVFYKITGLPFMAESSGRTLS